ncbi:glycoside hydrolase family 127 protein [Actinopolymorpha pittospori]|uniref:DUF1680 family protein n=1 Tax=Actinopolymorpha pittospori TaxID=648752 RepID=A0A927RJP0_9ACTN|nr:beta-L-arabinofuranosidase domain-containing protein [Actinopolymorpha pittospori]MBE1607396.1 DUF1680 family protein [Actinopolymorpha pittospori]
MQAKEQTCGPVVPTAQACAVERPLGVPDVRITGGPWARWQTVNRDVSFPLGLARLESEGNFGNLRLASGETTGEFRSPVFMDGAVHKMLEAAAWEVVREPNDRLEVFLTQAGELLERAQQDDGYLNSYYQVVRVGERYTQLDRSHEIYLGGLLALAGVARVRGGGEGALPRVARRFADHLVETFLHSDGPGFDGHPGAELAFVELYRLTGETAYLDYARKMVEDRGHGMLGKGHGGLRYFQDHQPVREAETVVGHAVRAMYLEAGIVDLYLETGDRTLLDASVRRFDDMVATKMSIIGGIGSRHRGEAFGDGYELPPDRAYNESCAAFAAIFWCWRLLLATGEGRYADLLERLLFNAFAASTSLDGSRFFYVNPLQRREDHFEADDPGRRCEWFACPCCPPNIMRLVSSLGHYLATTNADGIHLHQYAASEIHAPVGDGEVVLTVDTDYPWSGSVAVEVRETPAGEWTLGLRVPGWCDSARLVVAGEEVDATSDTQGYVRLTREWREGDKVSLDLDMPARLVRPDRRIDALRGCVALERGPLVYCFEQVDQPAGVALPDLVVPSEAAVRVVDHPDHPVLGRTVTVEVAAGVLPVPAATGLPYTSAPAPTDPAEPTTAVAVPYFQWDNRDGGGMRVWLPELEDGVAHGG